MPYVLPVNPAPAVSAGSRVFFQGLVEKRPEEKRSVLACQFQVTEDTVVITGAGSGEQRILERRGSRQVALNPLVKKIKAVLPQPSLADNRPD